MTSFSNLTPAGVSALDLTLLRETIRLSQTSRDSGRHPFAALVADREGTVIASAGNNSMPPEGDPTQHAELRAAAIRNGMKTLRESGLAAVAEGRTTIEEVLRVTPQSEQR